MSLTFNTAPYYDDFSSDKNYHRILFKAGFAVQARELTQAQSIQQDQITKFADNIFKPNTPVSGGQVTTNLKCFYIKLNPTYLSINIDVLALKDAIIQDATAHIMAKVIAVIPASNALGDPDTIIVSYLSGSHFTDGDIILNAITGQYVKAISLGATGLSSIVSISQGVFYVSNSYKKSDGTDISTGIFVQVNPQSLVLSPYSNTPSNRIGLNITENIYDYIDDPSLLDPALGSSNYQAPGADRYKISLTLESRPLTLGDDSGFIELVRIEAGTIVKMVDGSVYNVIDDYLAKRTYETNGDYVVNDFKVAPSTATDLTTYDLKIGKGTAFIRGYRVDNQSDIKLNSPRARTTASITNNSTYIEYGNFLYVNNIYKAFNPTGLQAVDLHVVANSAIAITNANTYSSTVAATAYIRNFEFYRYTDINNTATYTYKAYITGIQTNKITSNVSSATANTITFPSSNNISTSANAYVGVILSIDSGTSKGDIKRIISYTSGRVATVDSPFTTTPDSTSMVTLRFDIKDVESIVAVSSPFTPSVWASVATESKDNLTLSGNTVLQELVAPELIYSLGYPYVSTIANTSYNTTQVFKSVSFPGAGAAVTLNFNTIDSASGNLQFLGNNPDNYIVINNTTGEVVSFANTARTITLNGLSTQATLTPVGIADSFSATVIVKASISNADSSNILKTKSLILANTTGVNLAGFTTITANNLININSGQTYIKYAALVTPGQPQDIFVSDVKRIVKIIDTLDSNTTPTTSMLSNSLNDVTSNYIFDNGQRDSWYQHATITLRSGRPAAKGSLLICYDWYLHQGGKGYFSVGSYLTSASPEQYKEIPSYTAKGGTTYALRDSIDFRPAALNSVVGFSLGYSGDIGTLVPADNSTLKTNYSYYLGRKDKLILTKDKVFTIVSGTPSVNPILPGTPDGSLLLANLSLDPYTAYIPGETPLGVNSNLSVEKVQHKRWTMSDISDLQNRVNSVEYYTALNTLEKSAQSLQIPDVNGFNRFKHGILVDDFSSFAASDTNNIEFNVSINRRERILSASQIVDNFPLQSPYMLASMGSLVKQSTFAVSSVGKSNIYSLPFTQISIAEQKLASNTINVNPFATPIFSGTITLTPPMDNWVDNTKQPDLLIIDPNLQLYQSSANLNTLSVGDWKVIPGTQTYSTTGFSVMNHGAFNGPFGGQVGYSQLTTQTYAPQNQQNVLGYYEKLGSSYYQNGGYITDVSILPYIRPQQLIFRSNGLAKNTPLSAWFDGQDVSKYITNPDIIELSNVTGSFSDNDTIGWYQGSTFYPVGTVVSSYNYPGTANTRLYIIGSYQSSFTGNSGDLPITTIQNATFNTSGVYQNSTANGKVKANNVIITSHKTGYVSTVGGAFTSVNGSTTRYYRVWVGHGPFADMYGIWGSPTARGNLPYSKINFIVPKTGTYYVRCSADDSQTGAVNINTTSVWTSTASSGGSGGIVDTPLTLTAGTNFIEMSMNTSEDDGDAYFACAISSAPWTSATTTTDTIVFGTDLIHLHLAAAPTNVGSMTVLPGGGLYFVGVTELSLNGLASNSSNFYANSNISVFSQYVDVNQYTGVTTLIPSTYQVNVLSYNAANCTVTIASPGINISLGYNIYAAGDITSYYTLNGTKSSYNLTITGGGLEMLSTDESGSISGIFNIPASIFKTGDRIFQLDNRTISTDPTSATTSASATFTASGLSTKSQSINFSPSISTAKGTFIQTNYKARSLISTQVAYYPYDPIAQTFIIDSASYPNGAFINSIRIFFFSKSTTNTPITLSVVGTQNGYPNGETLDNSIVTKFPKDIQVSVSPHALDSTTYTEFTFSAPVYIQPGIMYAFMLVSQSTEYNVYIASKGSIAVASTVKNLPTDVTPTIITKIGTVPYVGSLFVSQNAMTWTADQGQSLMFILNRCNFDTTAHPNLPFVVPFNLPYRKLTSQDITSHYNANNVSNLFGTYAGKDILSDAYNITTTDFIPTAGVINYTYTSTLNNFGKTASPLVSVTPGNFASPTFSDIYLNDGLGERILQASSSSSFSLYAQLSSSDPIISPMLSDDGLSLYNIRWNINNLELANSSVLVSNGGTGYNANSTTITISSPNISTGTLASAYANVSNGSISAVYFSNFGSGYASAPTITINDPTTRSGNSNASIIVYGETSPLGGNGISKYFTKKVVLTPGNDSGDLRVFYTAYRPLGTNISIYYKILNRNDSQEFNLGSWQLMTNISNSNTYSLSRDNLYEFEAAPGINNTADNLISYTNVKGQVFTSFSQFAIKIVLSTSDKTNVPFLTDIRALALPSGTGV